MIQFKQKFALLIGALLLCLAPAHAAFAADEAVSAQDASAGLAFKVAYNNGRYSVFMKPNATPDSLNITLTAQVTLKVPHAVGADRFLVADVQNAVDGTQWTLTSRVDAPTEDQSADYLSFTVEFPEGNHQAYQWQAGQETQLFNFANGGACLGAVNLLDNSDAFAAAANSAHTNPGNQVNVLGFHDDNLFIGAYDGAAKCSADAAPSTQHSIFLPMVKR